MLSKFAATARQRMRIEGGGYRREHVRALAQRVAVDVGEVRILGSKSNLLQALIAGAAETKPGAVPSFVPKWCTRQDSNLVHTLSEGRAAGRWVGTEGGSDG